MTTPDTPQQTPKPITVSGFLVSSLMTGALICGAIGALAVVFIGDGLISPGPDPAIPSAEAQAEAQKLQRELAETNARLQQLEKAQTQQTVVSASSQNIEELQKTVTANAEQTQELKTKVDTLSSGKQEESKAAQIALGLTQLKTAYENDLPMAAGIETLKKSVTGESLQKSLSELATVTAQNFPTKKELLADIDQMKVATTPPPADPSKMTWDQRATYEIGKFVQVEPKQAAQERALLDQTASYIRNNNFTAALEAAKQFPATAQQKIFYKKIELRLEAENTIHKIISDFTQKIGVNGSGQLY